MRHPRAQGARQPRRLGAVRTGFEEDGRVGGRLSPSAGTSSRTECAVRIAWRSGSASVGDRSGCAVLRAQIASNGQSWQSLLFCSSGQHVMSAEIDAMPMASAAFTAEGVTKGARMRLAITDIARNRAINRRRTIPYPATADKGLEVALLHKLLTFAARRRSRSAEAPSRARLIAGDPPAIAVVASRARTVGHGQRRPRRVFQRIVAFPCVVTILTVVTIGSVTPRSNARDRRARVRHRPAAGRRPVRTRHRPMQVHDSRGRRAIIRGCRYP